jgi:hypothetical protein
LAIRHEIESAANLLAINPENERNRLILLWHNPFYAPKMERFETP